MSPFNSQRKKRKKHTMEQGEKKRNKSIPSLPLDLVKEILSKLPAKSVMRFRCASKHLSSMTIDPFFTKRFETCSSTRPSLLIIFSAIGRGKFAGFSIPQHQHNLNKPQHVGTYHMKERHCRYFNFTESLKGLICFQDSETPIVWNPSIRKFLTLPKPKGWEEDNIKLFLGYDPIEGKHKLVCLPRYNPQEECRVLTLGCTQESWRTVSTNGHKHCTCKHARCINGVVYYIAHYNAAGYNRDLDILMCFDVRSEKFDLIKLPEEYMMNTLIIPYEGKLAVVHRTTQTKMGDIKLWILEDADKHAWSFKYLPAFKDHDDKKLKTKFNLRGITDAGELVYVPVPIWFSESFFILYYNPKRNSFRKVRVEGIANCKFERRYGARDVHTHITNHIESLMSFSI